MEKTESKRNSRLGIASFLIGTFTLAILLMFGILTRISPNSIKFVFLAGLVIVGLFAPLLYLIGLILGIIGIFSEETKRLFPVLGVILNGVMELAALFAIWKILDLVRRLPGIH